MHSYYIIEKIIIEKVFPKLPFDFLFLLLRQILMKIQLGLENTLDLITTWITHYIIRFGETKNVVADNIDFWKGQQPFDIILWSIE